MIHGMTRTAAEKPQLSGDRARAVTRAVESEQAPPELSLASFATGEVPACAAAIAAGEADREMWFNHDQHDEAASYCASCPVSKECAASVAKLDELLAPIGAVGTWAGHWYGGVRL